MEGTTLGSYKILERLGAGGQGHVYRALDSTLEREIAIKVLPAAFVADPVRLKQFMQEAKLLAAASHPNIAAVYAIEDFEGVHFFTQELVEGRTLRRMIEDGPLSLEETLDILRQVAAGLEMAHERGLVHRDLKPANVMVTDDGMVKVLDFGLALPVDRAEGEEHHAISDSTPTISRSADSIIVGTAPYMSPDQARGRAVDRRSDIWAFGCLLFECLTGKRPFEGETLLDTLSAIVRAEPDWTLLPATTPDKLRYLLERCLRKRVSDRLQHIGDARIVIDEVLEGPLPIPGQEPSVPSTPRARTWRPLGIAVAALLGAIVGAAAWSSFQPASVIRSPLRSSLMLDPVRLDTKRSSAVELSPDGTGIVFAGLRDTTSQLYYRPLAAFEARPIDGTEGAENPFFSPDGDWIGFFSSDFKLARVPVGGGVVLPVADVPVGNWGAAWLPDDTIVYGTYSTGIGLMRVSIEGGEGEEITRLAVEAGETNHGWPHALPGGRALLFTVSTATGRSVAVVDLVSGERSTVIEGAYDGRFVAPDHLIFTQQGSLFATKFDLDTLTASGTPSPVVEDLFVRSPGSRGSYAIGTDGALVYAPGDRAPRRDRFVWVDREGSVEPIGIDVGSYGHPRLSPDNGHLAYDAVNADRSNIWVYDLRRETNTRLTDDGENVMPVWSPNGIRILYASSGHGATGLYWQRADGGGEPLSFLVSDHSLWPLSWHDQQLAYYELNPDTGRDIWILGGEEARPAPFQRSRFNERSPMFSPDGRWIAYVSNESGRDEIYVKEVGGAGSQHTISAGGGAEPVWSTDGRELFYRVDGWLLAVPIETDEGFTPGAPVRLFQGAFKSEFVAGNQYYDVALDGQRFVMIQEDETLGGPDRLHVVLDFASELAR